MLCDPLLSSYTQSRLMLIRSEQRQEFKWIKLEVHSRSKLFCSGFLEMASLGPRVRHQLH